MRRMLRTAVCFLAVLATGCRDEVVACSPCPMPPMRHDDEFGQAILGGDRPAERTSITFETFLAGRRLATYRIDGLWLRPPSGQGCDCGGSVLLLPTADGRLVQR